jgi:hypothetical protein
MAVTGHGGELKHRYHTAATIGRWEMDADSEMPGGLGTVVYAKVLDSSEFWMSQSPLDLTLRLGDQPWRFKDVIVSSSNGSLTIVVSGMPERVAV